MHDGLFSFGACSMIWPQVGWRFLATALRSSMMEFRPEHLFRRHRLIMDSHQSSMKSLGRRWKKTESSVTREPPTFAQTSRA